MPPARVRPARIAAAQPGAAGCDALSQSFGSRPGVAAARCRVGGLDGICGSPCGGASAWSVSRYWRCEFDRAEYRRTPERAEMTIDPSGIVELVLGTDVGGAGSSDQLCPDHQRVAGRRTR